MLKNSLQALFVLVLSICTLAWAQDYPARSITMIVPFAAGGPTDTLARNLGAILTTTLKQQVIVDNAGGAGGTIGINKVAKARNDGYTLLLMHVGMSTAPAMYSSLPYDTLNDFEYIGQVADVPMTLIGKKALPPNNFKELLPYLKANQDKLTAADAGLGAASQLCGLLFMSAIQTKLLVVSYSGTAPAMTNLIGGQVDLLCDQTTNTTQQIKAGTVKVYGVTSRQRIPSLKDIPTLAEQGLKDFEVVVWHGLYAPKGTPKPVLDKLIAALQGAVQNPTFKARLEELGAEPVPLSKANPESLRTQLQAEIKKWDPIFKKAGVHAD